MSPPLPIASSIGPNHQRRRVVQQGSNGRPVVLLHGLASLADEILFPLGAPLVEAGFHAISIDRPGYGGSDLADAIDMGPMAQAADLEKSLVRLGLHDAIILAHSAGAATALHLARQSPHRVAGLILLSPFCRPTRPKAALGLRAATAPVIGPAVRRALPRFAPTLGRSMLRATLHKGQRMPDARAFPWRRMAQPSAICAMASELRGFNADMISLRDQLRSMTLPTIVLMDPEDPVIDAEAHARWLEHRLPRCEIRLSAAGHLIHHFDPAAVIDAVVSSDKAVRQQGRPVA